MPVLIEKVTALETLEKAGDVVLRDILRIERKRGHVRFSRHKLLRQAAIARKKEPSSPLREIAGFGNNLRSYVGQLRTRYLDDSYQFKPHHVVHLGKPDGGKRTIMVHTSLDDKIFERAVYLVIKDILREKLNNGVSFCGIPKSKKQSKVPTIHDAHMRLATNMRQQTKWILKADIASFFDSLNKNRTMNLLKQHLPDDSLEPFFRNWLQADFDNPGQLPSGYDINKGIPQGSCISPIIANLYLLEFDLRRKECNIGLLRYADDLNIICDSENKLKVERRKAEEELGAIDLHFKDNKVKTIYPGTDQVFLGYRHVAGKVHIEDAKLSEWISKLAPVFRDFLQVACRKRKCKPMRPQDIDRLKKAHKDLYNILGGYSAWIVPLHIKSIIQGSITQQHAVRMVRYLSSACEGINRIAGSKMLKMNPFVKTIDECTGIRIWPYVVPRLAWIIDYDQI